MSRRPRIDPSGRLPLDPLPLDTPARQSPVAGRYVELNARSNHSFLRGASSPEALVREARAHGHDALAITDCDGLYGVVKAREEAEKQGVRIIVGCELTIRIDAAYASLVVLVEDHAGYTNLCRILTESHRRNAKGAGRKKHEGLARNAYAHVSLDVVCAHAGGLWTLISPSIFEASAPGAGLTQLREAFGARASLAVHRHLDGGDEARVRAAIALSQRYALSICATNAVRYARREDKRLFDVLHCIREGTTLDDAGRALAPNSEAHVKSEAQMMHVFSDHPAWIDRTRTLADACRFSMKELRYRFPSEGRSNQGPQGPAAPLPTRDFPDSRGGKSHGTDLNDRAHARETPDEALRRLAYEGGHHRYGATIPPTVVELLEKELAVIAKLEVAPYFLSVREIVEMARARDILCQGRGSAANSAVCYCLGVTAVDPTQSSVLFERFLSVERREPPDIDVDFEHERREEVIQEIYERYGRERAAMVSEVICYRGKSALREVGKVFGMSLEQIDRLAAITTWWDRVEEVDGARLRMAGFDPHDGRVQQILELSHAIQGTPRHLSIHVGGFVLSATPLVEIAPIEPATMPKRTVIPWDKDDLDALGFFKVDVLALGMLTAIRKALAMVQHDERVRAATAIDQLAKIPQEDPRVYESLARADTVGVFQIESRAQMAMLPRLKPRCFYDLVVQVAIVRPGPIQGGMVHPYLRRRNGEESSEAPHPILAPILSRTLGVPLFQEQVMQLAIVGAGYTGGEADQLRRDMAAWRKNGNLARHEERLLRGFTERGIEPAFAARLYAQIQGFGEYGFPESHAASFALLVYASTWLKVYHPAEFAAALVNSQPMGFYSPSTIVADAQRHGVEVRPIAIERSGWDCSIEIDDKGARALRLGLRMIRGLSKTTGERIEEARASRPFTSLEDLAARASIEARDLDSLASAGALESLQAGRRHALWAVRAPREEGLFRGLSQPEAPPEIPAITRTEQLHLDFGTTGVSVTDHPMRLLRPRLSRHVQNAVDMVQLTHGARAIVAGLVICRQRPQTASGVVFITLEDETGFLNLILYARIFEQFRHVATTSSLLLAHGKIEREATVVYLVVERLERLQLDDFPTMSRDFH